MNSVDWIWGVIGLTILLNIVSLLMLIQSKKLNHVDSGNDVQAIQQSMEDFVAKIETENDELYQQMVRYQKTKQHENEDRIRSLEEKIRFLEEQLEYGETSEFVNEPLVDPSQQIDPMQSQPLDEEKVLQLFKQGFSAKQIAKVLQMDYGEVELMINLFKKRQIHSK